MTWGTEEPVQEVGTWEDGEVCGEVGSPSSELPQDMEKEREALQTWKQRVEQELDRVMAFWMEHSHDQEHGCASPFWCPQQGSSPFLSPHLTLG